MLENICERIELTLFQVKESTALRCLQRIRHLTHTYYSLLPTIQGSIFQEAHPSAAKGR